MPLAINCSASAIALYVHVLMREAEGKQATGPATNASHRFGADVTEGWRQLVEAEILIEQRDAISGYSRYRYNLTPPTPAHCVTEPTEPIDDRLKKVGRMPKELWEWTVTQEEESTS